ncbi:hypothetical protein AWB79_07281 [Caballeronia hypogeia]|uniref:ATP-grasp domain-containing protein n=1 Tax=Caballeronia hypogeia TaxID=1777140 RepID=A0A158DMN7_9BURK|nr:hypothetical protein [Caballeronia hypogeia]SAK95911.1 hypothetical protein AWB79_07281 [Caballeronia hypogeia]
MSAGHGDSQAANYRIVNGKDIDPKDLPHSVVQRVIDNRYDDENVYDIRVPVIGNSIPFVYIKKRSLNTRFSNANRTATISSTPNFLSETEVDQILRFCRDAHLDYGELDVLRDRRSGDIWIVDVNNTPSGPPNGLTKSDVILAIREMAMAFYREFLEPGSFWNQQ